MQNMQDDDAIDVVLRCINQVSNADSINPTKSLKDAQIMNLISLNRLRHDILTDRDIGIPSKGFFMSGTWLLNITTGTTVNRVITIVQTHSRRIIP